MTDNRQCFTTANSKAWHVVLVEAVLAALGQIRSSTLLLQMLLIVEVVVASVFVVVSSPALPQPSFLSLVAGVSGAWTQKKDWTVASHHWYLHHHHQLLWPLLDGRVALF
jgi:hypothetical protein